MAEAEELDANQRMLQTSTLMRWGTLIRWAMRRRRRRMSLRELTHRRRVKRRWFPKRVRRHNPAETALTLLTEAAAAAGKDITEVVALDDVLNAELWERKRSIFRFVLFTS